MRVVLGEDEILLAKGLTLLLESNGFEVVALAASGDEIVPMAQQHNPDLLITDIRMPPTNSDEGLQAALQLRQLKPELPIVVLSQYVQRSYALELLGGNSAGVGYLLKQRVSDIAEFISMLQTVAAGGTAIDPEVISVLVTKAGANDSQVAGLTPRQLEVLTLMAEGKSNQAIAQVLFLTEKAVVKHISNIYDALGLALGVDEHRRVLAVIKYLAQS